MSISVLRCVSIDLGDWEMFYSHSRRIPMMND